jgi:4-nitrophenyl phosphatase
MSRDTLHPFLSDRAIFEMSTLPLTEKIRRVRLFLLDLDGTVYRGEELIPGAREFIELLRSRGIGYVFLTNNSSLAAVEYVKKIAALGLPVGPENVFTSGQATALHLLRTKPGARVFLVGTRSLAAEFAAYGITLCQNNEPADCVVIGYDTELTYEKLRIACELLDDGADYVATNPDFVCPIQGKRSLPDCGAICLMIEQATGKKPLVIGKPQPAMVHSVCQEHGIALDTTAVIGDRLYTDIAVGRNAGILSICTLTGESTRDEITRSSVKPDLVIESIDEMNGLLAP